VIVIDFVTITTPYLLVQAWNTSAHSSGRPQGTARRDCVYLPYSTTQNDKAVMAASKVWFVAKKFAANDAWKPSSNERFS